MQNNRRSSTGAVGYVSFNLKVAHFKLGMTARNYIANSYRAHQTAVGVIENVTMEHPFARSFVECDE
jgi:hypothetical protein